VLIGFARISEYFFDGLDKGMLLVRVRIVFLSGHSPYMGGWLSNPTHSGGGNWACVRYRRRRNPIFSNEFARFWLPHNYSGR